MCRPYRYIHGSKKITPFLLKYLLNIMPLQPKSKLLLIGDGELRHSCRSGDKKKKENGIWVGGT